jgi:uncharacterized protein YegL
MTKQTILYYDRNTQWRNRVYFTTTGTHNDKTEYTLLRQVQKWRSRLYFTTTGTHNDKTEYTLLWQVHTMTKQSILYYDRYTQWRNRVYFTMTGTHNDETEYTLLWQAHTSIVCFVIVCTCHSKVYSVSSLCVPVIVKYTLFRHCVYLS